MNYRTVQVSWLGAALALTLFAVALSLAVGTRPVPLSAALDAMVGHADGPDALVVRTLRVPRTAVGLAGGAALGIAGAALQAVTRNPLADPGVLGLSHGAAAGVVLATATGVVGGFSGAVWFAFCGAVVAACAVYAVSARGRGGASPVKLALAGTACAAMISGLNTVVLTASSDTLDQYRFWQAGSLAGRDGATVLQMLPFLVVGALLVLGCARGLDALALGGDTALALGHRVHAVRVCAALGATLLTAAAVAASGPLAFIGLIVPHLARRLIRGGHRVLLPLSALLGAALLLVADVVGRILRPPGEVPAGVLTTLIGVPVLVVLVRRRGAPA
ncbi:FecCD family ABC transporter permease [Streptomyces fractus]|uniref:FecCD family ABC transporter permease n=1 Tax=Streptomyces fractus TaxID=641806 RepID=UPI003CEA819B